MSKELLDATALHEAIEGLAARLVEHADAAEKVALIGIRTRGVLMAERLRSVLADKHNWSVSLGILDITLYRDDLSTMAPHPIVGQTEIDFDVSGKTIYLVDDVIYTGRTVRSAIDQIVDFGRPSAIRLVVLVDRGGRELPIQPDLCALTVDAGEDEVVKVCFEQSDDAERVVLTSRNDCQVQEAP